MAALYTTTSRPRSDAPLPLGIIAISSEAGSDLGQRAFLIDARRIAYIPATEAFFPDITRPGAGIQSRASPGLQRKIELVMVEILKRPDLLELLGPDVP